MKIAVRNILLVLVAWVYIFGSAGFTVHHCCCKKHYHVTCAIVNAWEHYVYSGCEKYAKQSDNHAKKENISNNESDNGFIAVVKAPEKHCADILFTMDASQYNNEDNLQTPVNYAVELLQYLPVDINSISMTQYFGNDINLFYNYDISHYRYRSWCTPDVLCTFII